MSTQISRAGIVEGVTARRKKGQVTSLAVSVRFETELESTYTYGDEDVEIDNIVLSVSATSGVNPGDIVALDIFFVTPTGQRFQPALEASTVTGDGELVDSE